ELKRRNVFRVGIAYVVTSWLLLQFADIVLENIAAPGWVMQVFMLALALGFPLALFFAWAFELTPEGLKKEKDVDRSQSITPQTGRRLDFMIIAAMALALAYFIWESRFSSDEDLVSEKPAEIRADLKTSESQIDTGVSDDAKDNRTSIAVLPFTHRSANQDDIYFTDGVHDDLLTQLSRIKAFKVISRTSVMEYRDTTKNLRQIGVELGVSTILEGAVQRAGDRVRITVQLIDAESDEHLWAENYDRRLTTENLFDIQTEIATSIANATKSTLSASELASVSTKAPTSNLEAYELYMQARRFTLGSTSVGLSLSGYQTGIQLYEEAIAMDPEFALAYVGLAEAHLTNYWSYGGDLENREMARLAIDTAITINAGLAQIQLAEGFYHYWGLLDYPAALSYMDKAIELMPGNAEAYMWRGWALRRSGQFEQAIESMRQSTNLDPRAYFNWLELGQTYAYLNRFEEAYEAIEKGRRLDPDSPWGKVYLVDIYLRRDGDTEKAVALLIGAQHSVEVDLRLVYLNTLMMARRFDEALELAKNWPAEMELARQLLALKEAIMAEILHFAGHTSEAREKAGLALKRLEQMKQSAPDDYRLYTPEANMLAILGDAEGCVASVAKTLRLKPDDAITDMQIRYELARGLAIAGEKKRSIEMLDSLIPPPTVISVPYVEKDPAFDGIRDDPAFIALLNRHRGETT
ncbi:MAG: tetratricopeptide repeat protein, partial [Gammaproteobacteria bacterium]|nr:tetratricopeptide repeat protein [Gammaproteobacteria bacterium]